MLTEFLGGRIDAVSSKSRSPEGIERGSVVASDVQDHVIGRDVHPPLEKVDLGSKMPNHSCVESGTVSVLVSEEFGGVVANAQLDERTIGAVNDLERTAWFIGCPGRWKPTGERLTAEIDNGRESRRSAQPTARERLPIELIQFGCETSAIYLSVNSFKWRLR